MGCGSPLGDLFYVVDALLYNTRPMSPVSTASPVPRGEDLRAQLYRLYGEGKLTEDVFAALRALADRGELRLADLAVHQVSAARQPADRQGDLAVDNAARGVRSRLERLAATRRDSTQVLGTLQTRVAELDQRIAEKEERARQAVGTAEEEARARLSEKADLTASRDRLVAQAEALRADLGRLDDLCAQLEAKATELEAVQVRRRVVEGVNP